MNNNKTTDLFDRQKNTDSVYLRRVEFGDYIIQLTDYILLNTGHETRLKTCPRVYSTPSEALTMTAF